MKTPTIMQEMTVAAPTRTVFFNARTLTGMEKKPGRRLQGDSPGIGSQGQQEGVCNGKENKYNAKIKQKDRQEGMNLFFNLHGFFPKTSGSSRPGR